MAYKSERYPEAERKAAISMAYKSKEEEEAGGCAIVIGTFVGFPFAFVAAWYQAWPAFALSMLWMIGWVAAAVVTGMSKKR